MRLALFGGTFDPIHNAHLAVAITAADRLHLDKILIVPAAQPPHKAGAHAPYADRLAMVRLAVAADPRLEASDIEAAETRSYSIVTIERIRERLNPRDELFFLIGADAFAEITTWYRWQDVAKSVEFIVVTRPGHTYSVPDSARVHELSGLSFPTSSSDIRLQLAAGRCPPELPDGICEYIKDHGLYGHPTRVAGGD